MAKKSHQGRTEQHKRGSARKPRSVREFYAMSPELQESWRAMTHAISAMRSDQMSLRRASREFGIDPKVVVRLGRSALRKRSNGQYVAKKVDRLFRLMVLPGKVDLEEVVVRDSREASKVGAYWDAVHKYVATGDSSALSDLPFKSVSLAKHKRLRLLTDLTELEKRANAGEFLFETIYSKVA